jgi:hypothetical protein
MTATKNNVPPNSTLVMTVLVLRTSPSRKPCTLRSPPVCFRSTESIPSVVLLPRISLPRTPVNKGKGPDHRVRARGERERQRRAKDYSSSPISLIFSGAILMVVRTRSSRWNG